MNSTALRAEAQSANNKHMVFNSEEHEKFYYEKPGQARYQDCYHKALIYILGMDSMKAGEAFRFSPGANLSGKLLHIMEGMAAAF